MKQLTYPEAETPSVVPEVVPTNGNGHRPTFAEDVSMRNALREPFPPEQILTLPAVRKNGELKRPALDYVSHAAVTQRLNDAAPDWTYDVKAVEAKDDNGWPHVVAVFGTMTIGGVSRQEVGAVDSPSSYGQELKEAISDFVRRAAMRFGVALDLWSKEDLQSAARPVSPKNTPSGSPATGAGTPDAEDGGPASSTRPPTHSTEGPEAHEGTGEGESSAEGPSVDPLEEACGICGEKRMAHVAAKKDHTFKPSGIKAALAKETK